MATLADIKNKVYSLTGTDSGSYADADMLINLNLWHQKIVGAILDSQDETDFDDQRYGDYPSVTWPLTTKRDYAFSQFQTNKDGLSYSILKIKDLSVSYDGSNFYRATPMDITDFNIGNAPDGSTTQDAKIDANFAKTAPRYDIRFNSLFLYPLASASDVAAGGKIIAEFFRTPVEFTSAELTAGTVSPGVDPTFHMMYAYGAAYELASPKRLPQLNDIVAALKDYEDRLRRQYGSKQLDRKYMFQGDFQLYK